MSGGNMRLEFASPGVSLPLADIYRDVALG
jgi:hypothetical protein